MIANENPVHHHDTSRVGLSAKASFGGGGEEYHPRRKSILWRLPATGEGWTRMGSVARALLVLLGRMFVRPPTDTNAKLLGLKTMWSTLGPCPPTCVCPTPDKKIRAGRWRETVKDEGRKRRIWLNGDKGKENNYEANYNNNHKLEETRSNSGRES